MEGYMTIKQAAEKWDVTPRRIQFLCSKGRIKGATKFGRDWAIPVDAKKPEDKRITTGEYKNWRKKKISPSKTLPKRSELRLRLSPN